MILLATVALGLALLSIQIALAELKILSGKFDGLATASQVFPHPNEISKPYQKRKL